MNTKQQGNVGVAMAIAHYTSAGYEVSVPLGDSTLYDLIVDTGGNLLRVQVKSTRYFHEKRQTYVVTLTTSGGNRSGTGKKKTIDATQTDLVYVYVLPTGQQYEFTASAVAGLSSLDLRGKAGSII